MGRGLKPDGLGDVMIENIQHAESIECFCGRRIYYNPETPQRIACICGTYWLRELDGKWYWDTAVKANSGVVETTRDRMAKLWEENKHLIKSDELKEFLCRAVMVAMEKWNGHEPPKAKTLTVTIINPEPQQKMDGGISPDAVWNPSQPYFKIPSATPIAVQRV